MIIKVHKNIRLNLSQFLKFIMLMAGLVFVVGSLYLTYQNNQAKDSINRQIKEIKQDIRDIQKDIEKKEKINPNFEIKITDLEKRIVEQERKSSISRSSVGRAKIYDIKLSPELQAYTYEMCKEYNVNYEMALSVMYCESNFNPKALNASNSNGTFDVGYMQINSSNHSWIKGKLQLTDLYNPYQNIKAGVYMLSMYKVNGDLHKHLMNYNMGVGGSNKANKKGIYSTKYSRKVVSKMKELKETSTIK